MLTEPDVLAEEGELRAALAEPAARAGRTISAHGEWLVVDDPSFRLPVQGWKIHVSARPATLLETVRRMLPALTAASCHFKVVRSGRALQDLNSSNNSPGSIGKAVTVYAARGDVVPLARRLAADLAGLTGPRVNSDRRVRPDAPVYYRFGPFQSQYRPNEDGDFELVVTDPAGGTHAGMAEDTYWQPPWDPDPFAEPGVPAPRPAGGPPAVVLGGRYRVERALTRNGKGRVYRALDGETGASVIVKEARAHVNEDVLRRDSRFRLRNERAALELLRDVEGVPRVLDHFRHGEQEYLVITDMGATALGQDVALNGLYTADPRDGRCLRDLAVRLLELVDGVHARGVLVRDVSPANVVLDDATGRPALVDFEIAHVEDPPIFGWTRGYASPEQERNEKPTVECDYYSLGATLFYAATGVPPTWMTGDAHNHDTARAAAVLDGRGGIGGTILGLLSPDPADRRATAGRLRAGRFATAPTPVLQPGERERRLARAVDHGVEDVVRGAKRLMRGERLTGGRVVNPVNLYRGAAGIGLELLHHHDRAEAADLARDLAYWATGFLAMREHRPGLYTGDTGTAVFVAAAGATLGDDALTETARGMARPVVPRVAGDDQHGGLAGIGLAELLLWDLTGDASRRDLAARCAERLAAGGLERVAGGGAPDYDDCGAVSRTLGYSHGVAGLAHFLLAYRTATGDTACEPVVRKGYDVLAGHMAPLLAAARSASAKPMHAAFCQGMAGIGASLVRAGRDLREDAYLDLAREAAEVCGRLAPRMYALTQCCGLAGIGELYLDLAAVTGEDAYRRRADRVADLILARAGGTPDAPVFPDTSLFESSPDWSTGTSGIVTFLRRLRSGGAARLWLDPLVLPA
ncbi:class IV lanthionine synthetase LanL [Actinomadura atramentaria]|uniref:class IV lanthionine synthetase LanL n=1 Tax=Actinomadura atramentaria TaxID=1990 RepID=UPI00037BA9A3|nr:class IV lanthionine synthetase LanL [Actinomadura atramentaria]